MHTSISVSKKAHSRKCPNFDTCHRMPRKMLKFQLRFFFQMQKEAQDHLVQRYSFSIFVTFLWHFFPCLRRVQRSNSILFRHQMLEYANVSTLNCAGARRAHPSNFKISFENIRFALRLSFKCQLSDSQFVGVYDHVISLSGCQFTSISVKIATGLLAFSINPFGYEFPCHETHKKKTKSRKHQTSNTNHFNALSRENCIHHVFEWCIQKQTHKYSIKSRCKRCTDKLSQGQTKGEKCSRIRRCRRCCMLVILFSNWCDDKKIESRQPVDSLDSIVCTVQPKSRLFGERFECSDQTMPIPIPYIYIETMDKLSLY